MLLAASVADTITNLNVQPACRNAATGDIGIKQDLQVCLDDERASRDQLAKEWSQFSSEDRSAASGSPTLVATRLTLNCSPASKFTATHRNGRIPGVGGWC
jgi:sRNA-binding protein